MCAPASNCSHRAATVWFATPSTQNPGAVPQAIHHPSANALPLSYPTATDSKVLLLTHKRLSASAPHFWGLASSSISPTVSRTADLGGLLPSSSCTAGKGAGSSLPQVPPHTSAHSHSSPKGRGSKRLKRRKEQNDATRSGPVPHQHRWGSLCPTPMWHKQNRDDILAGDTGYPSHTTGCRHWGRTSVHVFSWCCQSTTGKPTREWSQVNVNLAIKQVLLIQRTCSLHKAGDSTRQQSARHPLPLAVQKLQPFQAWPRQNLKKKQRCHKTVCKRSAEDTENRKWRHY